MPDYDYRQRGVYFVTVCTYQHASLFGAITDGDIILNDLGEVVDSEWLHVAQARTNVVLDNYVIMPNHLHGIVIIDNKDFHANSISDSAEFGRHASTLPAGSLGAIIGQFKAAVTRRSRTLNLHCNERIWQRNFYEHIVCNDSSLNEIRRYILENPAKWEEDSLYDE